MRWAHKRVLKKRDVAQQDLKKKCKMMDKKENENKKDNNKKILYAGGILLLLVVGIGLKYWAFSHMFANNSDKDQLTDEQATQRACCLTKQIFMSEECAPVSYTHLTLPTTSRV